MSRKIISISWGQNAPRVEICHSTIQNLEGHTVLCKSLFLKVGNKEDPFIASFRGW